MPFKKFSDNEINIYLKQGFSVGNYQFDIKKNESEKLQKAILNYRALILPLPDGPNLWDNICFDELVRNANENNNLNDLLKIMKPFKEAIQQETGLTISSTSDLAKIVEFHAWLYEFKQQKPTYIPSQIMQAIKHNRYALFTIGTAAATLAFTACIASNSL